MVIYIFVSNCYAIVRINIMNKTSSVLIT